MIRVGGLIVAALVCGGCEKTSPPSPTSASASATASATASEPLVLAPRDQVRWMQAPETTDVAASVRDAATRERVDGRTLVVYVGATWCEPCQRFHHAVDHGDLDSAFPRLSVLAFDADRDGQALAAAGYVSRLIPLFAMPNADGRASGKQIEGSVKGDRAVSEITPRLRVLLAGGS